MTTTSLLIKPVTRSLNVKVTGKGDRLVGSVAVLVIVIVGATLLYTLVKLTAAVFSFVAASVATLAATLTVIVTGPDGVMLAV